MNKILFTLILIGGLFAQDKELIKQLKSQDCAEFIELHSATYLSKETGLSEMYLLGNYHINLWQKPTSKGKGKTVGKLRVGARALILDRDGSDYKVVSGLDDSIGWVSSIQVSKTLNQHPTKYEKCKRKKRKK